MPDELEIGPGRVLFEDAFITVTIPHFDTRSGVGELLVDHKQEPAGVYHIRVVFKSGDSIQLEDNANPNNPRPRSINSSHLNDPITKVEVKRITSTRSF